MPEVAVVVATQSRAGRLRRLLDALSAQAGAPDFETVVVADGATPEVLAVLDAEDRAGAIRVVKHAAARGPAAARNSGWRAATAPLIAFTDDDCEPEPGWLAALAAAPGDVVQGRVEPHPAERDRIGAFSRSLWVREAGPFFQTANIRYPRELLERLGGFDEAFPHPAGEDTDLGWRAVEAGATTGFEAGALVYHAVHEPGPLGLARDAKRWGTAVRLVAKHPGIRAHLHRRYFWKRSHEGLLVALAGLLLARRTRGVSLLAIGAWVSTHRGEHPSTAALAGALPAHLLVDAAELAAMVRGSADAKALLL